MGVWMIGTGSISIKPQVEKNLIKEYIQFSKNCFPEEYGKESFSNTWFLMKIISCFQLQENLQSHQSGIVI